MRTQPSHSNASRFALLAAFLIASSALGFGQGPLDTSSSVLGFGGVAVGSSGTRTLSVINHGQSAWTITSAVANGAAFTISGPPLPLSLPSGGSASFIVTFTPPSSGFASGRALIRAARTVSSRNGRSQFLSVRLFGNGIGSGTGSGSGSGTGTGSGSGSPPPPTLQSISVSPTTASVTVGKTLQFAASGHFSDGSTQALSSGLTWSSSNADASVSATGVATGMAPGTATISASQGTMISNAAALTVAALPATLTSITLSPTSASVVVGSTQQFSATGHFSDGSTQALTTGLTWSSSSADATVSATGLAAGVAAGPATITVAQGSVVSAGVVLTVTAAPVTLSSITLSPSTASVTVGKTQQFAATGHFSDGTTQTLTTGLTWGASDADASVSATGLATGVAAGSATITAKQGSVTSAGAALTVTAAPVTLTSITVAPASVSISAGKTLQFTATGNFSDGSTQDLTSTATWKSSNTADATVSVTGLASGVVAGSVTITAAESGVTSNSAALAVTAVVATLQSITLAPLTASVSVSGTQQFTATGHFSDGSTQALTSGLTWASSSTDATVSASGVATGLVAGGANITASSGGIVSSPAALTVTSSGPVTANAFYVATTGSDSNPGTLASPWKTIQHAASTVQAGDTVYIRAGTYTESVNIGVSGSATAGPVTFQSYPGEQAIIDGTGLTPSTSDVQGLINIVSQSYVTINGLEIQNYQTSNANAVPAGIWVTGSGSNIQILNNIVHNIVTTSEANGNAFGIAVYGSGSSATTSLDSVTISGNQVYSLKTGESESVNVDGNVTNFVISHNLIHDNDNIGIDAIGFEGVSSNSAVDFARNGEISDNTVYNISAINNAGEGNDYDANGIYVDGGSQIVIERNIIHNVDIGIEMASEHSGHNTTFVTTRDNLVYNANSVGISIGGYANNVGGTDSCTIVNNTLFENDTKNTGSGEFQIQFHATNNVFENNIVYSTSQGLLINSYTNSTPKPAVTDYNIYFSAGGAGSADFLWIGSDHSGLAAYQSASGNDAHSQYVDPQFLSLTTPDLQVSATSPAIGIGTDLGVSVLGDLDLADNARVTGSSVDIGAYQQ